MRNTKFSMSVTSGKPVRALVLATSLAAASIVSLPVMAQGSAATATATTPSKDGQLDRNDKKMLINLLEGNRAEVQAGQLALEKSQNADIKKFAQMMVDDHGKAVTEIETLAQNKGAALPDGIGAMHKTKELALKALSGNTFDREYAKRAGVGDHESTIKLLNKIKTEAKDAEMKALADKMLPVVQGHLDQAHKLVPAK